MHITHTTEITQLLTYKCSLGSARHNRNCTSRNF